MGRKVVVRAHLPDGGKVADQWEERSLRLWLSEMVEGLEVASSRRHPFSDTRAVVPAAARSLRHAKVAVQQEVHTRPGVGVAFRSTSLVEGQVELRSQAVLGWHVMHRGKDYWDLDGCAHMRHFVAAGTLVAGLEEVSQSWCFGSVDWS
jgi:hypothetical protein